MPRRNKDRRSIGGEKIRAEHQNVGAHPQHVAVGEPIRIAAAALPARRRAGRWIDHRVASGSRSARQAHGRRCWNGYRSGGGRVRQRIATVRITALHLLTSRCQRWIRRSPRLGGREGPGRWWLARIGAVSTVSGLSQRGCGLTLRRRLGFGGTLYAGAARKLADHADAVGEIDAGCLRPDGEGYASAAWRRDLTARAAEAINIPRASSWRSVCNTPSRHIVGAVVWMVPICCGLVDALASLVGRESGSGRATI